MSGFLEQNSFLISLMGVNAILALSIHITLLCAMLSLSNAASAAIGAYTAAVLTTNLGWELWPAVLGGALLAALVALALGLPILRLRGVFLAIATLGFGEMVRIAIVNTDALGGAQGFRLNTGDHVVTAGFWQIYAVLVLAGYFFSRLKGSRMGLALEAIREDESAARTMGINVTFYKVTAYVIGAFLAGTAGALYAHALPIIVPSSFGFARAVDILVFAVIGGILAWRGAILGAFVMTILIEVLRAVPPIGGVYIKDYPEIFSGLILLAIILFLPNGLLGTALGLRGRLRWATAEQARSDPRLSELGDAPTSGGIAGEALRGEGPAASSYEQVGVDSRADDEQDAARTGAGPRESAP